MRRTLRLLALLLPLAACQLSLPGRDAASAPAANPITGGTITTTPLDAPAPPPATAQTDTPVATPDAAPDTAAAPTPPVPATATTAPPSRPTAAAADAPVPEPVATPAPKSEAQIACEDDGGTWARTGEGAITHACVSRTRDGGKRCDAKSDCAGECLARSRTCSPVKPLFGCNAVLMDNGAEVTLCLN